jgi:hypothetical protein
MESIFEEHEAHERDTRKDAYKVECRRQESRSIAIPPIRGPSDGPRRGAA